MVDQEFKRYKQELYALSLGLLLVAFVGSQLFAQGDFAQGLLAGGLLSLLNFQFLAIKVQKLEQTDQNSPKKTFTLFFIAYIITYLFMGTLLFIAMRKGLAPLIGAAMGLFLMKLSICLKEVLDFRRAKGVS